MPRQILISHPRLAEMSWPAPFCDTLLVFRACCGSIFHQIRWGWNRWGDSFCVVEWANHCPARVSFPQRWKVLRQRFHPQINYLSLFTCVLISPSLGADLCAGLYSWQRSLRLHKGAQHAVRLPLFIEGKLQFILQPGSCGLVQQTHSQTDSSRSVNRTEKVGHAPLQFISVDPNYKPKTVHLVLCFTDDYIFALLLLMRCLNKQYLTNSFKSFMSQ